MHACGALACRKNTHIHKIKTKQILIRITRWRNEKKSKAVRRQLSPVYEGFFKKPQTWDARWVFIITYLNGTITSLIYRLSTLASTPWFISTHPLLIHKWYLKTCVLELWVLSCAWVILGTSPVQEPGNTAEEQAQRLREPWGELPNVHFWTWHSCCANHLSSCDHLHKTYTTSSRSKWQCELGMGPQGPMLGGKTINSQGVLREV